MADWRPLLVICPASLRLTWADELDRWLPGLPPSQIHVVDASEKWRADVFCGGVAPTAAAEHPAKPGASGSAGAALASGSAAECSQPGAAATGNGSDDVDMTEASEEPAATPEALSGPVSRQVVVVSYHLLPCARCGACKMKDEANCAGWPHCITAGRFPFVIVDESHRLQTRNNDEALMVKVATKVIAQARPLSAPVPHCSLANRTCPAALHLTPHCVRIAALHIYDTCHECWHSGSKAIWRCLVVARVQADRAVLLSGTPSISRPFDLAGQLHALQPRRLGADFAAFKLAFAFRRAPSLPAACQAQRTASMALPVATC
jgi:hypothetical protein